MADTTNVAVDQTDWYLLFTAADPALGVGIQNFSSSALMIHVGTDPGTSVAQAGKLWVPAYDPRTNTPGTIDLNLDDTDTVYGRLVGGPAGRVTVLG